MATKAKGRGPVGKLLIGAGAVMVACCGLSALGAVVSPGGTTGERAQGAQREATDAVVAVTPEVTFRVIASPAVVAAPAEPPTPEPTATARPIGGVPTSDDLRTLAAAAFRDKLMNAEVNDVMGSVVASVDFDLGTQWDEGMALSSMAMECKSFCPQAFQYDIDTLELRGFSKFVDKYGNESQEVAVKYTLSKDLAGKLNWSNVSFRRLAAAIATEGEGSGVYLHPAMRAAWREWVGE